jgi:hypothetical protein
MLQASEHTLSSRNDKVMAKQHNLLTADQRLAI